jgi:hypothetical protein
MVERVHRDFRKRDTQHVQYAPHAQPAPYHATTKPHKPAHTLRPNHPPSDKHQNLLFLLVHVRNRLVKRH